jgi:hypothetical protein
VADLTEQEQKQMNRAASISTVLFLVGSLSAVKTSLAYEETSPLPMKTEISASTQAAQETNVLRQLAVGLTRGSDGMRTLRGSPYGEDHQDRLQPPMPGMDCGVDQILSYVSCYSSIIDGEQEAGNRFTQFDDELQAALPSDSWRNGDTIPTSGSIRSSSYEDQNSGARIDVDLIARLMPEGGYSYVLEVYGWAATLN